MVLVIAPPRYVYEEPPQSAVRLHLNECLYDVPDFIVENIVRSLKKCNLYPNKILFDRFRELLADYAKVDKENVYPFTGGDNALRTIFYTLTDKGDKILYINPSFAMIRIYSEARNLTSIIIDSYEDGEWWKVDLNTLIEKSRKVKLAVIVDPNNPTGAPVIHAKRELVESLSRNVDGYVVIDEAYYEFAGYTVVPYINEYNNIIIVRSLSKAFCLAGFRLGYIVADKNVMDRLTSAYTTFDIPTPSLIAGITALENKWYMESVVNEIKHVREKLYEVLKSMNIKVYRSLTNFLLIRDKRNLDFLMQKQGIYIKKIESDLYRLTVPPQKLYDKVIEALGGEL